MLIDDAPESSRDRRSAARSASTPHECAAPAAAAREVVHTDGVPRRASPAARWTDLIALTADGEIDGTTGALFADLFMALGDEPRASQCVERLSPRPADQMLALGAVAAHRWRRGTADEASLERLRAIASAAQASYARAYAPSLEALALADVDQERARVCANEARTVLAASREEASGMSLHLAVLALLAVGDCEGAVRLYVERPPERDDLGACDALVRAASSLRSDTGLDLLCELAGYVSGAGAPERLSDLLVVDVAQLGEAGCERLIAARPALASPLRSALATRALAVGDTECARRMIAALAGENGSLTAARLWQRLGDEAARDEIIERLVPKTPPFDPRRAWLHAPLLALGGRWAELRAALYADVEIAARIAGSVHPTAHPTIHHWQSALVGETYAEVRPGAIEAMVAAGPQEDLEELVELATLLVTTEPEGRKRVKWTAELGAALLRIGRTEQGEHMLNEALALAIALRGTWSGYPVRSMALNDVAWIARVAGREPIAIAAVKKLGPGTPRDQALTPLLEDAAERDDATTGLALAKLLKPGWTRALSIEETVRTALRRRGTWLVLPAR